MKKQKLQLADLQVESFQTAEAKDVNGGIIWTVTIGFTYYTQVTVVADCF